MDTRIQTLVADLQAAAEPLSKRSLAAAAGLHVNSLKNLRTPRWSPTIATLERLERVLLPQTVDAIPPAATTS